MKTNLINDFLKTPEGIEADSILRNCVHCGFCNATCPTYQLLGDELDGPRGRIYLIKQTLEGKTPSRQTQLHLDRCLTCRNCETTCPSGVNYSQLLNIGRTIINKKVSRSLHQRLLNFSLRKLFLSRFAFLLLLKTGQLFKPVLPDRLKRSIPDKQEKFTFEKKQHSRKILLIAGCVQPALKPQIDTAVKIIFDRLAIECIEAESTSCCGSLSHHLNAEDEAIRVIKNNIDNWSAIIEKESIEAICMTATGCGIAIKEYEHLLANDKGYADKARKISHLYKDPAEIISAGSYAEKQTVIKQITGNRESSDKNINIAFHPPCTLQHGMQLKNIIEPVLRYCGYSLQPFKDKHLCCGSAGTYSITQKKISQQLLSNKLGNINEAGPDIIVTANIGCQLHLQSGTDTPVKHWLELLV
ncbi:MAG: glycolate oxidase subunit GlcF [Gammaproteobacteria bacterium]|nr:MAG: glycolate oxidase subunit GlcF [Gammaproteobacteria bacterium]